MIRGVIHYGLDEIDSVADFLLIALARYRVLGITGDLGAGKTTLIQAVLRKCGVVDDIQSPTFLYVSTYVGQDERAYHHFDLYRLKSQRDFIEAGFLEYLQDKTAYALIEWPEIIAPLIEQEGGGMFAIQYVNEGLRALRYELPDATN